MQLYKQYKLLDTDGLKLPRVTNVLQTVCRGERLRWGICNASDFSQMASVCQLLECNKFVLDHYRIRCKHRSGDDVDATHTTVCSYVHGIHYQQATVDGQRLSEIDFKSHSTVTTRDVQPHWIKTMAQKPLPSRSTTLCQAIVNDIQRVTEQCDPDRGNLENSSKDRMRGRLNLACIVYLVTYSELLKDGVGDLDALFQKTGNFGKKQLKLKWVITGC